MDVCRCHREYIIWVIWGVKNIWVQELMKKVRLINWFLIIALCFEDLLKDRPATQTLCLINQNLTLNDFSLTTKYSLSFSPVPYKILRLYIEVNNEKVLFGNSCSFLSLLFVSSYCGKTQIGGSFISWQRDISAGLTPTLSAWPLRGHWALKSILWETLYDIGLYLNQLHDFSLLSLNSFLHPFLKSKFMKKNSLKPKKFHFRSPILI